MNANNLKIGDIIITDVNEIDGGQYPKIIVVGSAPIIVAGQNVSFHPVLKRNRLEDYYISVNTTTLNLNGDNIDDAVTVLSTMEDAFNFNIHETFDVDADDDWVEKVKKKLSIAFKKRNWVLSLNNANDDIEEDAHEVELPEENNLITSRFYVVVKHNADFDVHEMLNDVLNETDDEDVDDYFITDLND